ncbi:FecR domain-containing protein [Aggregicoccus sp. 17bor-14]|uniref:FecR domain-containing protein n=1 Tax=Myxococcaceae TaxID=31 RepID=UPI00129C85D3|nr:MULTISPECIES: FecR domain-containing protein [Myxococcaceae]MBF5044225.1 FecR domain-containing protein [Simulacricoccus sp. 17bor-14]MRI89975.1 FecR domain-containing protein [Aggregicoccus sp. 17bor-14]
MPSASPRRNLRFILGVLLILAALPAGYLLLLREPPPPAVVPPAAVAPPQAVELRIGELSGAVEVRRGGAWMPARAGELLRVTDAVRTGPGASALLVGGPSLEVKMTPGTEVSVEELTDSLSRLLLGNGMATARVRGGAKQTFELKAAGSDAVARTDAGTFAMSTNGQGTVAVGTQEGEVTFVGQGKVVIVRAGQQSIARPGQAPSDPTPLPTSLLLKVQWPAAGALRRRTLVVAGQSEPGTRLEVAGQPLTPDADGRFQRTVELKEGTNTLQVRAEGVGGAVHEEHRQVVVDTTPPRVGLDPGLWK